MDSLDVVRLKIRNKQFILQKSEIMRAPESLLANLAKADSNYDEKTEEFFFNRNPYLFQSVMDFYVGGKLHFPSFVCVDTVREELEFWRLRVEQLAPCCLDAFLEAEQKKALLQRVRLEMMPLWQRVTERMQNQSDSCRVKPGDAGAGLMQTKLSVRLRLWLLLEDPSYSRGAMAWSMVFFAVILMSNLVLCLETLPYFRRADNATWQHYLNLTDNKVKFMIMSTLPSDELRYAELFTVIVLILDLILRFALCLDKCRFWASFLNIIQVIALIPNIVEIVITAVNHNLEKSIPEGVITILGVMRLLRVTLVIRSAKGYPSLKILGLSIVGSWRELILMIIILLISVFIFSFLLFYAEFSFNDNIANIGVAIWWAMITMTTVGYGDYVPKSVPGIIVGNVCAVCGILLIALPVAVIGNNFNQYYSAMSKHERTKFKRKEEVCCF